MSPSSSKTGLAGVSARSKIIGVTVAAAVAGGLATYAVTAMSAERGMHAGPASMHGAGPHGMGPGMRGMGPMGPGMMGRSMDSQTQEELGIIHELLVNHDRITRTVTNLPDGIRTVTESDDPQIAQSIKTHVATMGQRARAGKAMNLPIESAALRAIYQHKDKIKTSVEVTAKGVVVVQTSTDAAAVAVLQEHAAEVTELVKGGMEVLHSAMMRNHGGMMRGGMTHR